MIKTFILSATLALGAATAHATTVNIDGVTDSGPISDAATVYTPVDLIAGTYTYNAVSGAYDAVNFWGSVVGCDGNGENCRQGWSHSYFAFVGALDGTVVDVDLARNSVFATEAQALEYGLAQSSGTFELSANQTVFFGLQDTVLGDNLGGLSFEVSRVPLPASVALLGTVLAGMVAMRRRRKAA